MEISVFCSVMAVISRSSKHMPLALTPVAYCLRKYCQAPWRLIVGPGSSYKILPWYFWQKMLGEWLGLYLFYFFLQISGQYHTYFPLCSNVLCICLHLCLVPTPCFASCAWYEFSLNPCCYSIIWLASIVCLVHFSPILIVQSLIGKWPSFLPTYQCRVDTEMWT